jgi:hypothetical protein
MANQMAKLQVVVRLLEQKGLVSSAELQEAIQSIAELPPSAVQRMSDKLQESMRERLAIRYQEILFDAAPQSGSTQ